jgi:flagellin
MSGIVISSAVRTNLLSLQNTSSLQAKIQERLSTGKKVNGALDNPSSFFSASGLNRRANELSALLDGMQQGVKTLEAADNSMKSITKNVESMQANIRSARSDKSFKAASFSIDSAATGNLQISGGSVTGTVSLGLQQGTAPVYTAGAYGALDMTTGDETYAFTVSRNGGTAVNISLAAADNTGGGTTIDQAEAIAGINADLVTGNSTIRVRNNAGALEFYDTDATNLGLSATIDVSAVTTGGTSPSADGTIGWTLNPAAAAGLAGGGAPKTVDQLVAAITANTALTNKVKATNDGGKLRIENLSTETLTLTGVSSTDGEIDGTSGTKTIGGNDVRKALINQFNDLRNQLDKLAGDASYAGVNLLKADKLKITFNETGTSSVEIQAKDVRTQTARGISTESTSLDIGLATATEFSDDTSLDARLDKLSASLTTLQTQSSEFGAALTTVQNRQDFTKAMINTLQTGSDSLVLADANEEAAKLLALNTRQQLSQTALSLASQADQAVLRLF